MTDKEKRRLEIISRIDDGIIEKNTEKRVRLMRGNNRKKWIVSITSMAAALALIATTVILLVTLLGKQVPVYTGMTVSNQAPTGMLSVADYNAPHRGAVDQNKPFPDDKKPIGDAVKDSLSVTGSNVALYYAKPGEYVYITVHVDNPDSFEILSFTLNGYKYANNMFEYGSDLENLILKVQIPADAAGVTSYTIDAIKYVDGEKIKDVRMDGDRTVDIAVYIEDQPTAALSGGTVEHCSISFTANVTDSKGLLGMSESKLYAVLYDGDRMVATKEIALGEQTVTFDGLSLNTLYQYAVVATYDALDGQGIAHHVLAKQAVYTKYVVLFDQVQPTPYAVSFSLLWDESVADKTLSSLALYQGETKVRDLAVTDTAADGLASDTAYRLVATYVYEGATETLEVSFSTMVSTVTFNSCGVTSNETLLLGGALPTPQRTGFTFAGWFTADGTQITTVPAQPVTVFAKWTEEAEASALYYTISGGRVTVTGLKNDVSDLILPAYIEGCPVTKLEGFDELVGLESIHLPETLTEIGSGAFSGCTALERIVLPKSLKKSGFAAFDGCTALTRVEYTGSFADWLGIVFDVYETDGRSNPVSISKTLYIDGVDITDAPPAIPAGITAIGNWALAGFDGLTEVVIPDSVQTLGIGAFSGCDNMTSLTTPVAGVTLNGYVEFMQLLFITEFTADVGQEYAIPAHLTTLRLTGNITEIPASAFVDFTGLTTVTLPDSLHSIGEGAFNRCSALVGINLPSNLQSIGQSAFSGCTALTGVQLPAGLRTIGIFAFEGAGLTAISVPAGVQSIGFGAFKNCTALESVSFASGSSLTSISRQTFFGCSGLTEIVLPATVQSIGDRAFGGCTGLVSITTPVLQTTHNLGLGDLEYSGSAGGWFEDDTGDSVYPALVGLTTVNVIGNITEIPANAFEGFVDLTTVTLPAGLRQIGAQAFSGCTALANVSFATTEGWWYASSADAAFGTALPAADLANSATAATYLKTDCVGYWWKRS